MQPYNYESHILSTPQIPFLFHPSFHQTEHTNRPNWHENIELLHCLDGSGFIQCDGTQTPFQKGDTYVVNSNMLHCIGSETRLHYQCLIIDNRFFRENDIPINTLHFQPFLHDPGVAEAFREITDAYVRLSTPSNDLCTVADIRYAVLGLIRTLCRQYTCPKPVHTASDSSKYVKEAINYIRKHLAEHISLDNISSHIGISKFHLTREFKIYTGSTVIDTVNLIRCTEAKQQIEQGISVSAAAISCGYNNLSYFTRTFHKYMGILPSRLSSKK